MLFPPHYEWGGLNSNVESVESIYDCRENISDMMREMNMNMYKKDYVI